ncbi:MAG: hypothetical protein ACOZNI_01915 [Myxococcota bacterium]
MTAPFGRLPLPNALALDLARPFVPEGLVRAEAWDRIRETAARVPRGFGYGCVEVRLDDDDQVDLLLCATTFDHNRETLAEAIAAEELGAVDAVAAIARAWVTPGHVVHDEMPQLWVEIDHPDGVARPAFAHVRVAPYAPDVAAMRTPRSPREAWPLIEAGVAATAASRVSAESLRTLRAVCEAAPDTAVLMYVNAPASRGTDTVRCELAVRAEDLFPTLAAVGWPGDPAPVRALVEAFPAGDRAAFAVVWTITGGEIEPVLSLEPSVGAPGSPEAWRAVFAVALSRAGASEEKVRGLHRWVGCDRVDHPALGWPATLLRGFDYKLVVGADGRVRAKAYMLYHPRFRLLP